MNREPIYPLPEYDPGDEVPRTVNEQLVPIFRALADDPDGWQIEWLRGGSWHASANYNLFPWPHEHCNKFRLVPKQKYVTVTIPVPQWAWGVGIETNADGSTVLSIPYRKHKEAVYAREAISKAMEEQG